MRGLERNGGNSTSGPENVKKHLLVLHHGIMGIDRDWDRVVAALRERLDDSVLVHVCSANNRLRSSEGIDVCGTRLGTEVLQLVSKNTGLETISMVGLSMGGLVCRFAAGMLYSPSTKRMAGLRPGHYISVATPHMGVSRYRGQINTAGLLAWEALPHKLGFWQMFELQWHKLLMNVPDWLAKPLSGRSIEQLFLMDDEQAPLLLEMTKDSGKFAFYSALKSFDSRAAFANKVGDQWIAWTNASLRFPHELPHIEEACGSLCVIRHHGSDGQLVTKDTRDDDRAKEWDAGDRSPTEMNPEDLKPEEEGIDIPTNPHRGLFARQSGGGQNTDKEGTGGGNQPHGELAANSLEPSSTAEPSPAETEIKLDELEQKKQENVKQMLLSLQELLWDRIDVSFMNSTPEATRSSHDLIIQAEPVKSSSFVRDGDASVAHLADYIAGIYKDVERTAPNAAAS